MTQNDAISKIYAGIGDALSENGFSVRTPESAEKDALPLFTEGERTYMEFTGEKGTMRLEFSGAQAALLYEDDAEAFQKLSVNYFDPESFDERDVKSLCNELADSIRQKYTAKKGNKTKNNKMPTPVSRSAAKNGTQSYDGNTLANRLTSTMYPDLKEAYRANYEKYGEFLAEEFFVNYGTARVIGTIKTREKQSLNKLFKILNDIYENGSNDTQSLIAVTILGEMNNDAQMCETAAEYMCDDMRETVLLVNKYLASAKGKRAKEKMKNPPAYKPKKEKKPKVVEKSKPLPKKPVFMIMMVGASLVVLIYLVTTQVGYTMDIANAKEYYENGDYVEAYTCFTQGAKVKAADEELYLKAKYTAYVQQQLRNYETYLGQEMHTESLNALICGVGRYDKNASDAAKAGASAEYDNMLAELESLLSEKFGMTLDQARELYAVHDKEEYTYMLYDIINGLGLLKEK